MAGIPNEELAREIDKAHRKELILAMHPERCPICFWPWAESVDKGCVPDNCSFRPDAIGDRVRTSERRGELESILTKVLLIIERTQSIAAAAALGKVVEEAKDIEAHVELGVPKIIAAALISRVQRLLYEEHPDLLAEAIERAVGGAYAAAQRECQIVRDSPIKCVDPCTEDWIAQRIGMLTPADATDAIDRAVQAEREACAKIAYEKRHWLNAKRVETPHGEEIPESKTPWGAIRARSQDQRSPEAK